MGRPRADGTMEQLRADIRGVGLRATPSRLAVLGLLRERPVPMSHAEVADELADQPWDRATIYRNLVDMAEAGLLRRTDMGDHTWRFEAAGAHHAGDEHPHFVCTDCGTVECLPELEVKVKGRKPSPRSLRRQEVEIQVRGLCDDCG